MDTLFFGKMFLTGLFVFVLGVAMVIVFATATRSKPPLWYALLAIVAFYGGLTTVCFSVFGLIWSL